MIDKLKFIDFLNIVILKFNRAPPRFRPLHYNGKTVCTTAAAVGMFCGGSAPTPLASPKEQDKSKSVTGGRGHLDLREPPTSAGSPQKTKQKQF